MSSHDVDEGARRQRLTAVVGAVSVPGDAGPGLFARICTAAMSVLDLSGAGVTVMASARAGRAGERTSMYATGDGARRLEELQLTTGEGPCLDALSTGGPVLVPDLAHAASRWPGFTPEALTAGAAAVFSFPLQIGAIRLGSFDLFRDTPGPLGAARLADALVLTDMATEAMLDVVHPVDGLDADGVDSDELPGTGWLPDVHGRVHQASGMVAARGNSSVAEGLLRVRAYAYTHDVALDEVARRIVDRELVLDDQP